MLTGVEVFGNNLAATAAHLGSVLGINAYHITTSAFRLVRGELHELMPGHIRDTPVDDGISLQLHPRNIQILKGDELIGIDQLTAFLMREILPPVGLPLVGMLQGVDHALALRTALLKFLFLALQAGDVTASPDAAASRFIHRLRSISLPSERAANVVSPKSTPTT